MRISDWSSDVCSSDLRCAGRAVRRKFLDRLAEGGGAAFGIGGYAFRRVWIGKARKADFPADAQGLVQWQVGRKLEQPPRPAYGRAARSEEHTSELQSLMRISYAVFCLTKKTHIKIN